MIASNDAASGPLTGVRVIELGSLLAAAYGARLLAEMGAEVIKVEAPGQPDPLRVWGDQLYHGRSMWWAVQSRNKKCITLNLREERGQEILLDLISTSDVLVENFRPGTLERWNLGYDRLSERNPGLILARVSGYGQTGPRAHMAGYAAIAEAVSGLRYLNGFPGGPPPRFGFSLGDSLGGMFAAHGILCALYNRDAGRKAGEPAKGQVVDVALTEACFALLEGTIPEYDRVGTVRGPSGTGLAGVAPSNVFQASDDKYVVIAANQDNVFRRLCAAMGKPELATDARFEGHRDRGQRQEEIEGIVADWVAERTADEVNRLLDEAGVPCGSIKSAPEVVVDEQLQAREMLLEHHDPEFGAFVGPGIVPKLSETPGVVQWTGPSSPGAHNEEVFQGLLGLSSDDVAELENGGIV